MLIKKTGYWKKVNDITYIFTNIAVMALVTYLIRMIPFAAFRKKIKSKFVMSFLYYVPYAVLSAMTIPAIFYSSGSVISAAVGLIAALALSFLEKGLLIVAASACGGVLLTELIMNFANIM